MRKDKVWAERALDLLDETVAERRGETQTDRNTETEAATLPSLRTLGPEELCVSHRQAM